MKIKGMSMFWIPVFAGITTLCFAAVTPQSLILKVDEIRNPQLDYTVAVKVTSTKANKAATVSTFDVMVKGRDQAVVVTLTPAIDRGRVLLMSGKNFWAFMPNVSKPLRISLQERLVGEVVNGDLARTNFSGDYDPSIQSVKTLNGKKYFVMDLKAKSDDVTYGRVVLWVDKTSYRPLSAEFYAFSGRLLKTCSYEGYKGLGGRVRPTRMVMRDAINKEDCSVLEYTNMKVAPLPDKYFTKDYMKKLTNE